jgi:type VI secretion system secreted protein Hcp
MRDLLPRLMPARYSGSRLVSGKRERSIDTRPFLRWLASLSRPLARWVLALGFVAVPLRTTAWAVFDIFVKIDGIEGESTDSKHKGEIEAISVSYGASQSGTLSGGGGGGTGKVNIEDVRFVKRVDKASPKLFTATAAGDHFPTATFTFARAGGDKQPYLELKLSDVLVGSIAGGGEASGELAVPTEMISLRFSKIEWKYTVIGTDGKASGNVSGGWDLQNNKKL